MKTLFVATLLIVTGYGCASNAQVASDAARITWTNATELEPVPPATTGEPIPDTGPLSLKTTQIQRGSCASGAVVVPGALESFGTLIETLNVPKTITVVLFENLAPGKYCYRARHIQENGAQSKWSGSRAKMSVAPPPTTPPKAKSPVTTVE